MESSNRKKLSNSVHKLAKDGFAILDEFRKTGVLDAIKYNFWFNEGQQIVRVLIPNRLDEFNSLYRTKIRAKDHTAETYGIGDFLSGVGLLEREGQVLALITNKFQNQVVILGSALSGIDSVIDNLQSLLQSEIFEEELETAAALAKTKQLRAAGAIAGVVLEKHLSLVCSTHNIQLKKKDPSISEYSAELKAQSIVDLQTWKHLDYLSGIRNLCCHHKGREPSVAEIDDLLSGVRKITKLLH